uniref:PiggyBac transposable element-derived protein domain-containing protein n=1 Tax=Gouania willdenowi TaxID=441366 RepID=A0A8C5EFR8_GOUWI
MRRLVNVDQALQLFFDLEEAEDIEPESESESESDDDIEDPSFVLEEGREEGGEDPQRSATRISKKGSGRMLTLLPQQVDFNPGRVADLFLLFFATDTIKTYCSNTNKNAAKNKDIGKKYKWADIKSNDLYKIFGILLYMSLVSLPSIKDFWKHNHILSEPTINSYAQRQILVHFLNVHLSDPEEDLENDRKKGTPGHDKLFIIKPLYEDIRTACQAYYHPKRELAVDERMVPTKWGLKLFVLAKSSIGYTIGFDLYTGKKATCSEHGLSDDVVMNLGQPSNLCTGYHIYVDNFYTSPKLFMELSKLKFGACGTYRENQKGCPRGRSNALTKKSERGTLRWICEGQLVFVKWMDTREVSVCSTIHPAVSEETVRRKVKDRDRHWAVRNIPCPAAIMAYNKHMGGADLSDQLIQYYSAHRKTARWYKTVLLHFLDIATTNAYILHRELSNAKEVQPMSHKDFVVELVCQLCDTDATGVPQTRRAEHIPVPIVLATDSSQKATKGRLKCVSCQQKENKRKDTPWKCQACDVPLCVVFEIYSLDLLYKQ